MLQAISIFLRPSPFLPPYLGIGAVHSMVFDVLPSPNVMEQEDQTVQSPQLPSTKQREIKKQVDEKCMFSTKLFVIKAIRFNSFIN